MAEEPVCGMYVDVRKDSFVTFCNDAYYFCSALCRIEFERDSARYVIERYQEESVPLTHTATEEVV